MPSRLVVVTSAPTSARVMFDAALDVDAHVASMRHTGERVVAGVTHGRIGLGESVTWTGRHLGVRFTMTARVTALERPHRFVDEQVVGPFSVFVHEHVFTERDGVTVMTDTITVGAPLLGRVAERLVIVPYLRRLIRRRGQDLARQTG